MNATASTPGPWKFDDSCEVYPMPSIRMNGVIICRMVKQKTADEYDANGRLLAAAPELVAALEGMLEWARRVTQRNPGMEVFNACNALAKAKGR